MNISEANAVNHLLRYVMDYHGRDDLSPATSGGAREAAILLAGKANKALHAGLTGDEVRLNWRDLPRRASTVKVTGGML